MKALHKQTFGFLFKQLEVLIINRIGEIHELQNKAGSREKNIKPDLQGMEFINNHIGVNLNDDEKLICLLGLLPYLNPGFIDGIIARIFPHGAELPEMGGIKGTNHRGFIPTGETALFLLAGTDINKRLEAMQYFNSEHPLSKNQIIRLETVNAGEPFLSGKIVLNVEIVERILFGSNSQPALSFEFPAKSITTKMNWEDLVLNKTTNDEIETIKSWIHHNDTMVKEWNLQDKIKAGYKALFYGPPGTGKTFTATLLGKHFDMDVFRIDLSQVVSKYIGETEKNLEKIFQKAEDKNWILFFDEADALFGKRTSVSSAHDRYANQETSYLLQRIEDFSGLVILSSNNKANIDPAFLRRFNAIVHFPLPDVNERLHLWQIYLPQNHKLTTAEITSLAGKYEVTGATVLNAIHHSAINTFTNNKLIEMADLMESLKREFQKEDRMIL
jgi:AAA+ superfamily predicted ATPase